MRTGIIASALVLGAFTLFSCAQNKDSQAKQMETTTDSLSYAWGVSLGNNMSENNLDDIDLDLMVQGIRDQWGEDSTKISMQDAQMLMQKEMMARQQAAADEAKKAGEDFLAENREKEGVEVTDSGLQYKVIEEGDGKSPDANDKVTVHYHGTLPDGTVFDSSKDRGEPATLTLGRVIPGWTEGLQMMEEGAEYRFFIPQDLAYGPQGQGAIEPYSTLIFDVELINVEEVEGTEPQRQQMPQGRPQGRPRR